MKSKQADQLRNELKVFKMRIMRCADLNDIHEVYISSNDYQRFLKAEEVNANGNLREARHIRLMVDRNCKDGNIAPPKKYHHIDD